VEKGGVGVKILVVEDMQYRIDALRAWHIGADFYVTDNTELAIEWLQALGSFDRIYLDHDLANEHYAVVEADHDQRKYTRLQGTGMDVAEWLRDHPEASPDATIVCHSLNPTGRYRMVMTLIDGGRRGVISQPFSMYTPI
jgi:hypothetical protein